LKERHFQALFRVENCKQRRLVNVQRSPPIVKVDRSQLSKTGE
jgi:hypothetical protein